jgi:hypothetical protein
MSRLFIGPVKNLKDSGAALENAQPVLLTIFGATSEGKGQFVHLI